MNCYKKSQIYAEELAANKFPLHYDITIDIYIPSMTSQVPFTYSL